MPLLDSSCNQTLDLLPDTLVRGETTLPSLSRISCSSKAAAKSYHSCRQSSKVKSSVCSIAGLISMRMTLFLMFAWFMVANFISVHIPVASMPCGMKLSQVAIVYADGAIVDGDGTGKDVYGNTLAEKLARVRRNDKVRAVVLRVNSPGGSALASDVIWREMELLRAEKPVIVSMGAYAASGGYYISCPADVIVADRMTLTGSIGVYGMYLDAGAALKDKLGITFDGVRSNTSADMGFMRPLSPVERSVIMRGVDKVYTTFTRNVAAGRNLPLAKVLEIAQGRVWSGEDALGIGLIDTYGGLYAAIAIAADKAELGDDYRVTEVFDEPMDLPLLFQFFGAQLRSSFTRSELGDAMQTYEQIQEAVSQQGVVMYCPYRMDLEEQ